MEWEYFSHTLDAVAAPSRLVATPCAALEQVEGSKMLGDFRPDPLHKYAFIAGHEVDGVAQPVVDACELSLEIPQAGTKHSLNVAVSTAITIWHFFSAYNSAN